MLHACPDCAGHGYRLLYPDSDGWAAVARCMECCQLVADEDAVLAAVYDLGLTAERLPAGARLGESEDDGLPFVRARRDNPAGRMVWAVKLPIDHGEDDPDDPDEAGDVSGYSVVVQPGDDGQWVVTAVYDRTVGRPIRPGNEHREALTHALHAIAAALPPGDGTDAHGTDDALRRAIDSYVVTLARHDLRRAGDHDPLVVTAERYGAAAAILTALPVPGAPARPG